jgi:hypothetical protein
VDDTKLPEIIMAKYLLHPHYFLYIDIVLLYNPTTRYALQSISKNSSI